MSETTENLGLLITAIEAAQLLSVSKSCFDHKITRLQGFPKPIRFSAVQGLNTNRNCKRYWKKSEVLKFIEDLKSENAS